MSSIHVRETDSRFKSINCIFHIAIPATNNAVGTPWNEALQKSKTPEPLMPDNDTTENANISSGDILEIAVNVRFSSTSLTNAQRLAEIQGFYNTTKDDYFAELQTELNYFGHTIEV